MTGNLATEAAQEAPSPQLWVWRRRRPWPRLLSTGLSCSDLFCPLPTPDCRPRRPHIRPGPRSPRSSNGSPKPAATSLVRGVTTERSRELMRGNGSYATRGRSGKSCERACCFRMEFLNVTKLEGASDGALCWWWDWDGSVLSWARAA